jgi:hypothetical protein
MDIHSVTVFLGWCTLINSCLLLLSGLVMIFGRKKIMATHTRLFKLSEVELSKAYFYFLAFYKVLIIYFNIVPYIALSLMFS